MSNYKFELGQKVLVNGEEEIISSSNKNFSNGTMKWNFQSGRDASEEDLLTENKPKLKRNKKKNDDENTDTSDIKALRAKYLEVTGKKVAPAYMNKAEWIQGKINAAEAEKVEKYEALKALDFKGLCVFIEEQEDLDIDTDDYDDDDAEALLEDVCEALGIDPAE